MVGRSEDAARAQEQRSYREQIRENDRLIIDRLMGLLHTLPRRERQAVLAGASFMEEADSLREALRLAVDLLRQEGYDRDPDYRQEWQTITEVLDDDA